MTPEEKDLMDKLVAQIQTERDPVKFSMLVEELNDLLESKDLRLNPQRRVATPQN